MARMLPRMKPGPPSGSNGQSVPKSTRFAPKKSRPQRIAGAGREERALSEPVFAVRKRLPWLQINLATAFLAAAVVGLFESTIAQFTALAADCDVRNLAPPAFLERHHEFVRRDRPIEGLGQRGFREPRRNADAQAAGEQLQKAVTARGVEPVHDDADAPRNARGLGRNPVGCERRIVGARGADVHDVGQDLHTRFLLEFLKLVVEHVRRGHPAAGAVDPEHDGLNPAVLPGAVR